MPRTSKPKPTVELPRGHYAIAVLAEDMIRLDLLDRCLPAKTGVPEDGWGGAVLTCEQAIELAQKLTGAAVRARSTGMPPKGRKKP